MSNVKNSKPVQMNVDKDLWHQLGLSASLMDSGEYGRVTKRRLLEAAIRYAICNTEELLENYDGEGKSA